MKRLFIAITLMFVGIASWSQDTIILTEQEAKNFINEQLKSGIEFLDNGYHKEGYENFHKALHSSEKIFGENSLEHINTLRILAFIYHNYEDYNNALKYTIDAKQIAEDNNYTNSIAYYEILTDIALTNIDICNYTEALKFANNSLQRAENHEICKGDTASLNLMINLYDNLLKIYLVLNKYEEAKKCTSQYLKLVSHFFKINKYSKEYAMQLGQIARVYYEHEKYDYAINCWNEQLAITEKVYKKESEEYEDVLYNLAKTHHELQRFHIAHRYWQEYSKIEESIHGNKSKEYAISLFFLGRSHSLLCNYKEAYNLYKRALQITKNNGDDEGYSTLLASLTITCRDMNRLDEALSYANEDLKITEKVYTIDSNEYASALGNLAIVYSARKNIDKALKLHNDALLIHEKISGKKEGYITTSSNIAICYNKLNRKTDALNTYLELLPITDTVYGREHALYFSIIEDMLNLYDDNNDLSNIEKYSNIYSELSPRSIQNYLNNSIEKDRDASWSYFKSYFLNDIHKYAFHYQKSECIKKNACDAVLLGKGLLLSTSQEMHKLIAENGDSTTISLYDEMRMNRMMLDRLYEKPIAERHLSTDSLEHVANDLERQLIEKSKAYGDYTRKLLINTDNVQKAMNPKEVCVEFVSFPLNQDSTMYVAYVIKKDSLIYVPLFEDKQLTSKYKIHRDFESDSIKRISVADIYSHKQKASELIWKPLSQYLDGAENIYFAPSGELYNIAIESLPDWENPDRLMSDRWPGLCRVSSTREVAISHVHHPIKTSVTYGGLKYGMDSTKLVADSRKYGSKASPLASSSLVAMLKSGNDGDWEDMPLTKEEAEAVHESLEAANVSDTPYLEEAGTEASFKALSGQKKNMMFISTHGFFWNKEKAAQKQRDHTLQFIRLGEAEDEALTRSGQVFTGANFAWNGNELPEGVDDGFLTAKEISQLDLRGLELVVLSACQTGLGDVSGEGVFGLQRGFKKAGAQTILMSLWEVEIQPTKLLMTEFCKNVFEKKMPKREALREAQKAVRNHKGQDFSDPYYWAGFILLDAID